MSDEELINESIALATKWQLKANELTKEFDVSFQKKMQMLLDNEKDKNLLIALMDQCFRSSNYERIANQISYLFQKHGMASFFSSKDRLLLWLFENFAHIFPNLAVPLFINQIREDSKSVVIKGEESTLKAFMDKKASEKTRVNVNLIGEVVLGEKEAQERLDNYINALKNPHIDYVSIKVSTLFSQINVLDFEHTVKVLVERLSLIYDQALTAKYVNFEGVEEPKFINLDMEEYRDLEITLEVFKRTLSQERFKSLYAGIVLQAYLPDSYELLEQLTAWAKERVLDGGSPIKVRLVKGANMQMEKIEASQRHWALTTYAKKIDTDANYKKMVQFSLKLENAQYVHIGTASHNLFEQAFATVYAKEQQSSHYHTLEMLEGMSEGARLAIKKISSDVIVYAPIAKKEQFTNAIAYLVRRLDENTQKGNFIRYAFGLSVDSPAWNEQKQMFIDAFSHQKMLFIGKNRQQSRTTELYTQKHDTFVNEADTDFSLKSNRLWAEDIVKKYQPSSTTTLLKAPIVIGGKEIRYEDIQIKVTDKRLERNCIGFYSKARQKDLLKALEVAVEDKEGFRQLCFEQRQTLLQQVANKVRQRRADLIGIAAAEVGKVFSETDVEVSESVDFLEFYPYSMNYFQAFENLEMKPKGVALVVAPWNFPIAIILGGIAASLAAGNCVLVKPSSSSVLSAYQVCKCFWDAGISKRVLQFLPSDASLVQETLISDERVDYVILTGSEQTAVQMLQQRPQLMLSAETGGKNATIVTALADREQAIKNVCHSAFSNSGQKCSTTSLLVLEKEVYEDESFKQMLLDAVQSMPIGSVWNFANRMSNLALEPSEKLMQAINTLEEGEEWLLEPKFINGNEYMLCAGIKYGVKEQAFCHMTELFGPILSVMKAENLDHAINIVNATGYGLTSAIESLDEREIEYWKENIEAGNLYINRGTTGAIVLRQPFGGLKKSAIGSGRKVGFFNYVTQFVEFKEKDIPHVPKKYSNELTQFLKDIKVGNANKDIEKLQSALQSYYYHYETEFSKQIDYTHVRGEHNIVRYLPLKRVAIRVCSKDSLFGVLSRILAAKVCGVPFTLSINKNSKVFSFLASSKEILFSQNDELLLEETRMFVKHIKEYDRILYASIKNVPKTVFQEAAKHLVYIVRQKPMMEGRLELLNYFSEQSISHSYHRYGNLGENKE